MNRTTGDGQQEVGAWSVVRSCAWLAAAILPAALAVAWIHDGRLAAGALRNAILGGGLCWVAASAALMSTFLGNRLQAPVPAMLIGMLFRMGLPLVGLIVLPKLGGPFADGGLTATILGTYLVGLIVETVLSLRLVPRPGATRATA